MQNAIRSTRISAAIAAIAASLSVLPSASAAELDGSKDLVCAAVNVVACAEGASCVQGLAKTFELPEFIFMDFKGKVARAHRESGLTHVSPFKNMEKSNTQLVVQGVENGHGWGIAIDRTTGRMTATVSGEQASFMIFGACTAL